MTTPPTGSADAVRAKLAAETLRAAGQLRLQVNGWSMFPAVRPGDTLDIECAESQSVLPGDLVLFMRAGRFFVHRVVDKHPRTATLLTRGDSMPQLDPPIPEGDLLGKVVWIERRRERIQPRGGPSLPGRLVSALLRRSDLAIRVVVGVHGMLRKYVPISRSRVVPCHN